MNKTYIYLTILILVLSFGIFFLPDRVNEKNVQPEELMWEIVQPTRYVTTDQVSMMIIEKDPTLELIDVRSIDEYEEFSLPGAANIPLDSIIVDSYQEYLGIEDMNAVFYSNDDIKADQAWVIARRMGYNNIYVMKDGLNCWVRTIIQPVRPSETASKEAFEQYNLRRGASMYFSGSKLEEQEEGQKSGVTVKRKKKTAVAEGGC